MSQFIALGELKLKDLQDGRGVMSASLEHESVIRADRSLLQMKKGHGLSGRGAFSFLEESMLWFERELFDFPSVAGA
jgi:hypothetical protein